MTTTNDHFGARTPIETPYGTKHYYRLDALAAFGDVRKLPISIRVLLESCLRNYDDFIVTEEHLKALMNYDAKNVGENEIPFMPGRVVLQDFTGVPCVVDLAAMRLDITEYLYDEQSRGKGGRIAALEEAQGGQGGGGGGKRGGG